MAWRANIFWYVPRPQSWSAGRGWPQPGNSQPKSCWIPAPAFFTNSCSGSCGRCQRHPAPRVVNSNQKAYFGTGLGTVPVSHPFSPLHRWQWALLFVKRTLVTLGLWFQRAKKKKTKQQLRMAGLGETCEMGKKWAFVFQLLKNNLFYLVL